MASFEPAGMTCQTHVGIRPRPTSVLTRMTSTGATWVRRMLMTSAVVATLGSGLAAEPSPKSETGRKANGVAATNPWWSLAPLSRPVIPTQEGETAAEANPIDAFVASTLMERGFHRTPQADRRTLIRRLYFDLIGLPPTPEAISAFVGDSRPDAYERLVDELLASPRYGERWARHWLDVVHYGETHGYDKDQPRPNAWPYRDYVIRSFNEDKPYSRFVQEQVAGDVLFPGTRDGFEALGFIAAGPWDLIGHAEVPETKIDGKVARHLDRDDMVANTIQTFNSLTIQCAQCHNHKFDPISQEDYYRLQAVFAAVDRADKKYDIDPDIARQRKALEGELASWSLRRSEIDQRIKARAGDALVELDRRLAAIPKSGSESDAYGYHSAIEKQQDVAKWVQVDLGRSVPLGSIVLHPCKDDFNGIGEGFGFPLRYKVEISDDPEFGQGVHRVGDSTQSDVPNPKLKAQSVDVGGKSARYIRVTATRLAPRQDDFIFALAEVSALTADGRNVATGAPVTALDSVEAPVRWQKVNLTDGWHPGVTLASLKTGSDLQRERTNLLARATTPDDAAALATAERASQETQKALAALPTPGTVYIGAVHKGSGAFSGTGSNGGKPRPIHILNRGNVLKPGEEVGPGTLSCLSGLPSQFDLPAGHTEGDRRAALALWLTRPENPLTWRSIVNRVWQYHFGRGLVDTPNDFGRMGGIPTHPELLDWLAVEFRDGGQSLKTLHKLIVTSQTYRQRSTGSDEPRAVAEDSDNRYLWRQNRRKLEAESIRDAVLAVAGRLNLSMGGPSFQDFVVEHPEHSPHYEYHLHDPEDPKSHRRSIYRFIVRSQQQPFMTVLDCADPSMQVGRRNESLSPLQALSLLNNSLMLTMSKHFAERLEGGGGDLVSQVRRGHEVALGRSPTPSEEQTLAEYARSFGLTNYCRLLLNLNEFSFVD